LAAGVAACLLIFLAAQSTFLLDPSLAPDLGRVPGMTAAQCSWPPTTASQGLRPTEEHVPAG
jgi:hypothetical protein